MIVKDVIQFIDDIRPNAFNEATKTQWITECEGYLQTEVLLLAVEEVVSYTWPDDQDTELIVRPPHDKIYAAYVAAMIDFANGEYQKYDNSMQMYNAYLQEYRRWFTARYRPADLHETHPGIYLSAYGLAVKHGYLGTEEEWLAELKGDTGERGERGYDFRLAGYYATLEDLEAVVTDPAIGDVYMIGSGSGRTCVLYTPTGWTDVGDLTGPKGDKGDTGDRGPQGETGPQGAQGPKGDKGDTGDRGPQGEAFTYDDFTEAQLAALKGAKGDKGDRGDTGEAGADGAAFTYADFTPEQLAALKGPKGDTGDTGAQGAKGDPFTYDDFTAEQLAALTGPKGDTGETGATGAKGDKGDTGATGAQGPKGDKGDKGDTGEAGAAFTYSDFTAEQLAALTGPKGDTGDTGATGPQGPKGDKGDKGDTGEVALTVSGHTLVFG